MTFFKVYTSCGCLPQGASGNPAVLPKSPCGNNCLYNPGLVVQCSDSVVPGGSGTIDVSQYHNADTFCGGPFTYNIVSFSSEFSAASIDAAGLISFTFKTTADPASYPIITFIVKCTGEIYSAQSNVQVCVQDICSGVICPEGEVCDPLTGTCIPLVDIEVS